MVLFIDFDRQVKESKQAAEEALTQIEEIQQAIDNAFEKAYEAQTNLKEAKSNADSALRKALEADVLAKNTSANAENIKNDAEILFKNASVLGEEAILMSGRVSNTKSEFNTLLDQTRSNDTLIQQAKEKVSVSLNLFISYLTCIFQRLVERVKTQRRRQKKSTSYYPMCRAS